MNVATETRKHFVDLWERETVLRRKRIVVEAPSGWDAEHLKRLDGEVLDQLASEYGCGAGSEIEDVDESEILSEIHISGPVPEHVLADIVFVEDESGELIDAESGDPAPFVV